MALNKKAGRKPHRPRFDSRNKMDQQHISSGRSGSTGADISAITANRNAVLFQSALLKPVSDSLAETSEAKQAFLGTWCN